MELDPLGNALAGRPPRRSLEVSGSLAHAKGIKRGRIIVCLARVLQGLLKGVLEGVLKGVLRVLTG